jgi:hypothetical protein
LARSQSCKSRISIRVGAQTEQESKQSKSITSEGTIPDQKLIQRNNLSRVGAQAEQECKQSKRKTGEGAKPEQELKQSNNLSRVGAKAEQECKQSGQNKNSERAKSEQ